MMRVQPCGGAIPLCMIDEFDLPADIIDRKVTKMKMISPSNREVDVGKTLSETEYIGMCRREVRDEGTVHLLPDPVMPAKQLCAAGSSLTAGFVHAGTRRLSAEHGEHPCPANNAVCAASGRSRHVEV